MDAELKRRSLMHHLTMSKYYFEHDFTEFEEFITSYPAHHKYYEKGDIISAQSETLKYGYYIKQGISNKAEALKEILEESQIPLNEVAVIGDDLNDLSMFKMVHYSFAPKDSAKEIKKHAKKVLKNKGGEGAVREMIDYLIKKEKLQAKLYEIFL